MIRHAYRLSNKSNLNKLNTYYRYLKMYYSDVVDMCKRYINGQDKDALKEVYDHPLFHSFDHKTVAAIHAYAYDRVNSNAVVPYNEGMIIEPTGDEGVEYDGNTTVLHTHTNYGDIILDTKIDYIKDGEGFILPSSYHLELQRCTDMIWYLLVVSPESKLEGDEDYYDEEDGKPHDKVDISGIFTYNNYHVIGQVVETRLGPDQPFDITGSGLNEKDPIRVVVHSTAYKDKCDATIIINGMDVKIDVQADEEIRLQEEQYLHHVGWIMMENGVNHLVLTYHREVNP